jgi:hypothetical protein
MRRVEEKVLCRSAQRRFKEEAMISSAEKRLLVAAAALSKSNKNCVFSRVAVIEPKFVALQKRHARTARFYMLKHSAGRFEITTQFWERLMTLLNPEAGFCQLSGTLGLRPNFHQLEDRVDGHIFISVLAYHLLRWIGKRFEAHNDMRDWQTIRRLLGP